MGEGIDRRWEGGREDIGRKRTSIERRSSSDDCWRCCSPFLLPNVGGREGRRAGGWSEEGEGWGESWRKRRRWMLVVKLGLLCLLLLVLLLVVVVVLLLRLAVVEGGGGRLSLL